MINNPQASEREEAVRQIVAGAGNVHDRSDVSLGLEQMGFTVHPVRYQGMIVGAIMEKGGEFHTCIAPEFQKRWNPRPYIKSILYPALDTYGVIYSDAKNEDANARRWLEKLGFIQIREDRESIYFELKQKRFR